jgi:hypothetical protein
MGRRPIHLRWDGSIQRGAFRAWRVCIPPAVITAGRAPPPRFGAEQVVLCDGQSATIFSSVPRKVIVLADAVLVGVFHYVAKTAFGDDAYLRKGWLCLQDTLVMKGAVRDLVYSRLPLNGKALGTSLTLRSTFNPCLFGCLNSNGRALTLWFLRCYPRS